jgi:regulator of chromosome condensation|tara:strand:+ start:916 stop:2415 length:1500 start_codon:yes stop_codon:yes gene_type:complete
MEGTEGSENDSLGKYRKSGIQAPEVSPNPYGRLLVYTWGIGGARVARPSNPSATPPNIVEIPSKFSSQDIIHISFSGHSAFLLRSGELLTAGRNDSAGGGGRGSPPIDDSGQLGRDGDINSALPVTLPDNAKVTATSCGRYHTVALTSTGEVLTFGLNDRGQLGRSGILGSTTRSCGCDSGGNCNCSNDSTSNSKPGSACIGGSTCRSGIATKVLFDGKILGFDDKCKAKAECQLNTRAVAVAAGRYSSAAVFEDGTLVVWGLIACGTASELLEKNEYTESSDIRSKLLHDPNFAASPRNIRLDPPPKEGVKILDVALGYVHLVVLTSDGSVYTCATGFDGYASIVKQKNELTSGLGRKIDSVEEALKLQKVLFHSSSNEFIEVSTGRCHVLARNKAGEVYSWGCSRKSLGRTNGEQEEPGRVKGAIEDEYISSVASGEYFSLVSSLTGKVYGWGSSSNGQLGQISSRDEEIPFPIDDIKGKVVRVSAGYQHAGAIVGI